MIGNSSFVNQKRKKKKKNIECLFLLHFLILYIVRHITYKFSFCNSLNQIVKLFTVLNSFFDNKYKEEKNYDLEETGVDELSQLNSREQPDKSRTIKEGMELIFKFNVFGFVKIVSANSSAVFFFMFSSSELKA